MKQTLDSLKINQTGVIYSINTKYYIKKRLFNLGIIKGTKIKPLYKSPFNDPKTYLINQAVIALRNKDAKNIIVIVGDNNE